MIMGRTYVVTAFVLSCIVGWGGGTKMSSFWNWAPRARGLFFPFQCFVRGHCKQIGAIGFSPGWSPEKLFREQGSFSKIASSTCQKVWIYVRVYPFFYFLGGIFSNAEERMMKRNSAPPPLPGQVAPLISYFSFMSSPILTRRHVCALHKMNIFNTYTYNTGQYEDFG